MNKTYKKSDIDKYMHENKKDMDIQEDDINELVDSNGSIIDKNDNYRATPSIIKSKKTTDDYVRSATQGPEAYFIYGGPYYGINYRYVVNEEDNIDENISPETIQDLDAFHGNTKKYSRKPADRERRKAKKMADKDIKTYFNKPSDPFYDTLPAEEWRGHSLPYDTKFDFDFMEESEMKKLVDEMFLSKKEDKGIVKRANEQDMLGDKIEIADITELKKTFEKPMVIRKLNHLLDLVGKEQLNGEELAIVLNHLLNNVNVSQINEKYREILGDKIKYGEPEE